MLAGPFVATKNSIDCIVMSPTFLFEFHNAYIGANKFPVSNMLLIRCLLIGLCKTGARDIRPCFSGIFWIMNGNRSTRTSLI